MKRLFSIVIAGMLTLFCVSACANDDFSNSDSGKLIVYNWADFIDEELLEVFTAEYKKIDPSFKGVSYQTCDTPDTLYTKIVGNSEPWHLGINADYLAGKMLREGRLQSFPVDDMPNYQKYVSSWSKEQYRIIQRNVDDKFDDGNVYGIGYMWGTMGILYNVKAVEQKGGFDNLFQDWNLMWNPSFKNRVYMKNSIRETTIVGALKANNDELVEKSKTLSNSEYNEFLAKVLTTLDDDAIAKIEKALLDQKSAVNVMYDVDFDKNAMANGAGDLDYCWAGDGYYAIQMGAEQSNPVVLSYAIPETGTNLFFDGFFLNGNLAKDSKQYKAAIAFVEFMCDPENALKNMEYIGYTSAVADISLLKANHDAWQDAIDPNAEVTYVKDERLIAQSYSTQTSNFNYFFGDDLINEFNTLYGEMPRLNPIQYPKSDEIYRCAVIRTFTNEENEALLKMWARVKTGNLPIFQIIVFILIVVGTLCFVIFKIITSDKLKNMKIIEAKATTRLK